MHRVNQAQMGKSVNLENPGNPEGIEFHFSLRLRPIFIVPLGAKRTMSWIKRLALYPRFPSSHRVIEGLALGFRRYQIYR